MYIHDVDWGLKMDNDYDTGSAIKFIFGILNKYDNPTTLIKEMLEILGLKY